MTVSLPSVSSTTAAGPAHVGGAARAQRRDLTALVLIARTRGSGMFNALFGLLGKVCLIALEQIACHMISGIVRGFLRRLRAAR